MRFKKYHHCLRTLLFIIFTLYMLLSSGTFTSVLAANETVLDISQGDITVSATTVSGTAPDGTAITTVNSVGYIIVGTTTNNRIIVESGAVNLTLQNVDMQMQKTVPAIFVEAGASLTLDVSGNNTLTGGAGYAAISVAPLMTRNGIIFRATAPN